MKRVTSVLLLSTGMLLTTVAGAADSGADLAKAKGCMGCHELDKKKVGPGFKEVAVKHKGDKGAQAKLTDMLKEGTPKGHPVKASATDAELKTLVDYVLSQK
jgi:cytochrome c